MPTAAPPFIPEEFDLRTILESGLGQAALPIILGATPAIFGRRGGEVAQGVGSGLQLALGIDQARRNQAAKGTLAQVFQRMGTTSPGLPPTTSSTPSPMATGTPAPTPAAGTPPTAASPPVPSGAFNLPSAGASTSAQVPQGGPVAPPTGTAPAGQQFDLGALLAAATQVDPALAGQLGRVFMPPTAKPLDPATEALRREQTALAQARRGQVGQPTPETEASKTLKRAQADAARARADRLRKLGTATGGPFLGVDRGVKNIERLNWLIRLTPEDDPLRQDYIDERDAILQKLQDMRGGSTAGRPITPEIAREFLNEAGGDPEVARKNAKAAGYTGF